MIPDPVLCESCSHNLQIAAEFKKQCLETETKIRKLFQSVGANLTLHHVQQDSSDKPHTTHEPLKTEPPPSDDDDDRPTETTTTTTTPTSASSSVAQQPKGRKKSSDRRRFASKCTAVNRQMLSVSGPVDCNFCGCILEDMNLLREHQKECEEKKRMHAPSTAVIGFERGERIIIVFVFEVGKRLRTMSVFFIRCFLLVVWQEENWFLVFYCNGLFWISIKIFYYFWLLQITVHYFLCDLKKEKKWCTLFVFVELCRSIY